VSGEAVDLASRCSGSRGRNGLREEEEEEAAAAAAAGAGRGVAYGVMGAAAAGWMKEA
jgi:hypothetical protein